MPVLQGLSKIEQKIGQFSSNFNNRFILKIHSRSQVKPERHTKKYFRGICIM